MKTAQARESYSSKAMRRLSVYELFITMFGFVLTVGAFLVYMNVYTGMVYSIWVFSPFVFALVTGVILVYLYPQYSDSRAQTRDNENTVYMLLPSMTIPFLSFYIGSQLSLMPQLHFTLATVGTLGISAWFAGILTGEARQETTARAIGFGVLCTVVLVSFYVGSVPRVI